MSADHIKNVTLKTQIIEITPSTISNSVKDYFAAGVNFNNQTGKIMLINLKTLEIVAQITDLEANLTNLGEYVWFTYDTSDVNG